MVNKTDNINNNSVDAMDTAKILASLTAEEEEDFREAFGNFDKDGDGFVSRQELGIVMRSLGYNPTEKQLDEMMKKVDLDGSGNIDFSEFVVMMKAGDVKTDFEQELHQAFKFFDTDGSGLIDREELAKVMRGLGAKLSDQEIAMLLDEADENKDGEISITEFLKIMYN